jgi:L-rhamnose mutarotase
MQRMGQVIRLKPEALAEYTRIHATVWPEILALLSACNITNYSIFLKQPDMLMFAYWEYTGTDTRAPGEWWARMEQVFFHP